MPVATTPRGHLERPRPSAAPAARTAGAALIACAGALAALLVSSTSASAQEVHLAPFGGQAFELPFYVGAPPGDEKRVFVVEGTGVIRLVKAGVTRSRPFLDISRRVMDRNEAGCACGMFSIAFAPDYASSGLFYVAYTRASGNPDLYKIRIDEFRRSDADPNVADPASGRKVLAITREVGDFRNGGQLQFGPDGLLYASVGDQNQPASGRAQLLTNLNGKLLRIDPRATVSKRYSIPATNPFADGPGGSRDEIYSYGLRNPYRFSFDRATGDLVIGDVGARRWEEVDFAARGAALGHNYGWPCFEGAGLSAIACDPLPSNPTPPVLQYAHPSEGSASVIGGYVIRDGALPSLLGRYVFADTGEVFGDELQTAHLTESGASDQDGLGVFASFVVSFGEDACGHIYVAELEGNVYRLEPTSGPFPCAPSPPVSRITDTDGD